MQRHLRFTYNIMLYQSLESVKESFLSEHSTINPILKECVNGLFINEKIIVDKENETLTIYQNKEYLGMFEGKVGRNCYNLSFEKYITDKICKEYDLLIQEIDDLNWKLKKEELSDYISKIRSEVIFIKSRLDKYWDEYFEKNLNSQSTEIILDTIEVILEKITEHLDEKYNLKIISNVKTNIDKENLLKLVAESKIDELFKVLFEFEGIKENIEVILLSSRWNKYKQHLREGTWDRESSNLDFSNIIKSLTELIIGMDKDTKY